jgi:hypothetical protein
MQTTYKAWLTPDSAKAIEWRGPAPKPFSGRLPAMISFTYIPDVTSAPDGVAVRRLAGGNGAWPDFAARAKKIFGDSPAIPNPVLEEREQSKW